MTILILYHQKPRAQRKAISRHLEAFGITERHKVEYWNIAYGIPEIVLECGFDVVIFHFTFFLPNINKKFDTEFIRWSVLKRMDAYKIALVQDEYVNTSSLCKFFKEFGVKEIFTCLPESLFQPVYPKEKTGIEYYHTVLTGYIDDQMIHDYGQSAIPHKSRRYDIAYRARKMPYNLGFFGTYKWRLTEVFKKYCEGSNFKLNLSNDPQDFLFGEAWYSFVGNTRTMLGCEGGASLHDPDGIIRSCCEKLMLQKSDLSFEDVEEHCFKNQDGKFPYFAISPRHFEAAVSKTCQVLIEGHYNGILIPWIHYIPIMKDWSNMSQVLEKIADVEYCENLAEKAYTDLVLSKEFTYPKFIDFVYRNIEEHIQKTNSNLINNQAISRLRFFRRYSFLIAPKAYAIAHLTEWLKQVVWFWGWDKKLWFKKIELKIFGHNSVR
ncbi:MAG: hypothetical protein IPP06_10805 [Saprospiraceae bacterium]|nr:hypothetical protein [Candidatus Vicinibacter affinis]MBK7303354.1 hypothetical protein [Candidatus Vicinibacter affinis]MBK7696025.1 hypothetical protein [Candidatus Vicinibacter affinis]MBK8642174.1 hypothetical protein [Candidatus Vicinibacter affinis]MBK9961787.1 hypothetical protein [Candidatus Vicinibacter affinis]